MLAYSLEQLTQKVKHIGILFLLVCSLASICHHLCSHSRPKFGLPTLQHVINCHCHDVRHSLMNSFHNSTSISYYEDRYFPPPYLKIILSTQCSKGAGEGCQKLVKRITEIWKLKRDRHVPVHPHTLKRFSAVVFKSSLYVTETFIVWTKGATTFV